MPWIALNVGKDAANDIHSLDYSQMLLPTVLIQSLRRKHFPVFLASVASIILKIQIVLSPSIFESTVIRVSSTTQIQVLDAFGIPNETDNSLRPDYHARAVQDMDVEPPFGVFREGVYQTFSPSTDGSRPTLDTPLAAVVDGLFMDMSCLLLKNFTISVVSIGEPSIFGPEFNVDADLHFEGCAETIKLRNEVVFPPALNSTIFHTVKYFDKLENRQHCSSLPQQHPEFLFFAAYYPWLGNSSSLELPELLQCAAVVCSPTTWVSRVEVVDDGLTPNISLPTSQEGNAKDININL